MTNKPIDGVGMAATSIGAILIYAGIRGYSVLAVIQNLVTGKPITTDVNVTNPLSTVTSVDGTPTPSSMTGAGTPKAIGQQLASEMGWTGVQWTALNKLFTKESGWNPKAKNPSSGAYGIPQALPYMKMPKAAWPESAGGYSDATTQIRWGLNYIKQRYGNPVMAWTFHQKNNWY
jgi:hypothetical protein